MIRALTAKDARINHRRFHRFRAFVSQFIEFFWTTDFHGRRILRWSAYASLALFGMLLAITAWRLQSRLFSGPRLLLWLWFAAACAGPAAYLLAAIGIAELGRWRSVVILLLITLFWSPALRNMYRQNARSYEPYRQIARAAVSTDRSPGLILVHSIPSGVLGIARYFDGSAAMSSWVGQLGNRRVPESMQTLGAVDLVSFVKIHEVGEPAPEEDWLRANDVVVREKRMGAGNFVEFCPKKAETF